MSDEQNIKLAVDAVVFGYMEGELYLLLIKRKYGYNKDSWALPGGFVENGETLEQAVKRELIEETGVKANYLEQLYTFGEVERDHRRRVVSVAYIGLVNPQLFELEADTDASEAQWFLIRELPSLAFDHDHIAQSGLKRLRAKLSYEPIGFELLNSKFPFSDLEQLYQGILGKHIDRRNFRKKLLSFGFIEETEEYATHSGSGRPGKLFEFNEQKYSELKANGIHFEIKLA